MDMDGKLLLTIGLLFPETPSILTEILIYWLVLLSLSLFFFLRKLRGVRVWLSVQHLYFGGLGFDFLYHQKLEIMS